MKLFHGNRTGGNFRIIFCILLVLFGSLVAYSQFRGRGGGRNFGPGGGRNFGPGGGRNLTPLYDLPADYERPNPGDSEFTFARMKYTGIAPPGYGKNWNTDWDKSDRQFILGVQRLTNLRIADEGVVVELTDPDLYKYPFLYSVESGHWDLTEPEIAGLREYLKRGGFLFCDDFWGSSEWENFEYNLSMVLPESRISDIPMDHPVFHSYYDISEIIQTPFVGDGIYGGQTYEQDGDTPYCRGVFDDQDRLMVIINFNTDLGDSWEWADLPEFPAKYSTYAYKIGINAIIYAMSH